MAEPSNSEEDRELLKIVQQLDGIIGDSNGAVSVTKAGSVKGYELSADRNGFLRFGAEVLRAGLNLKDTGPIGGLDELEHLRLDPSTSIVYFYRNDDLRNTYSDIDGSSTKKQSRLPYILMIAGPMLLGAVFLLLMIVGAIAVAEWLAVRM